MENDKQYYFLGAIDSDNFALYYGVLKAQIPKVDIHIQLSDSLRSSCECYMIFECKLLNNSTETIRCLNTTLQYFNTYEEAIQYKEKNKIKIFFSESVLNHLTNIK